MDSSIPTSDVIALLSLALVLPTATILPFILHLLKSMNQIKDRMTKLEKKAQCPYKI